MTLGTCVYLGAEIFDGERLISGQAMLVGDDGNAKLIHLDAIPEGCPPRHLDGGVVAPGYVDLQVNGGGGVMFNDAPNVETLATMAKAHRRLGTAAILPTLITDTLEVTAAAIDAVVEAVENGVEGIVGLHLEGPHLSDVKKGAHAADLIRPMENADLAALLSAAERVPNLMVTVAPESVSSAQIAAMAEAGVIVALGHTDARYSEAMAAFDAGARMVTHLYNAMSGLHHRDPGLVGAALDRECIHIGIIADGIHVHERAMALAMHAVPETTLFCLVTDAMASAGADVESFTLNGREITRANGKLTLEDGTLAGADLDLTTAIEMVERIGVPRAKALSLATSVPASVLTEHFGYGRLDGPVERLNHIKDGRLTPLSQLS